jgi:hypothetical protein
MKKIFLLLSLLTLTLSCSEKKLDIQVKTHLSSQQEAKLKFDIVRYIEDLPKYATAQNKFDTIFDADYRKVAEKLELLNVYKNPENDTLFFAIAKIAPSLKLKKTTTAGKLVYDKTGKISFYEERFRTWKMEVPVLKTTTEMVFQKYIQDKDLTEFYTKNSNGKFIIEFPDDKNSYDAQQRKWIFIQ